MKDEQFVYYQDVKEKKITSRSARNQRTHTGKGGRVKLPSDNLTQKELKAMSGEVKSYRLNEPMTWVEFKAMPDDLKVTYIKLLRQKFDVSDREIAKMFGISQAAISKWVRTLGIAAGTPLGGGGFRKWDEAGWRAWLNREAPPQIVEEPTPEEISGPFLEEDVSLSRPKACVSYKPQKTNADRIRAMTDEELVELVDCFVRSESCSGPCRSCSCLFICRTLKDSSILDWLKQPCEDSPTVEKG